MFIATLLLTALAGRVIYLQIWLTDSVRLRTERSGWLEWEVRRRVHMERMPEHVSAYPVPREERLRVCRLLGLVLWHSEMSIALPGSACAALEKITPQEFDLQFPASLRLAKSAG